MIQRNIRRVALVAAGTFNMAASPIHSASVEAVLPEAIADAMLRQQFAPVLELAAQPQFAPVPVELAEPELAPGDYVWRPERASEGAVEMVVSIPLQRAYIYRGGTLIGVTTVSTGREGHETPTGSFPILEKRREHYSNLYNNAPMPFMQRLTWDGIALHAGQIPGRPASHGCVRLPLDFARLLFGVTRVGATVHIIEQSPTAPEALAMVRGPAAYTGMGGPEEPLAD